MDMTTTYTRRENARRAGIAAGVPRERVKITVHKADGEVRFGWTDIGDDTAALQPRDGAAATLPASAPAKHPRAARAERNGVARPHPGGKCAAVWEYLDAHPMTTASEMCEAAAANGWNPNNATCELYAWRKFNGANGRTDQR